MVKQSPLTNPKNQAGGIAFTIATILFPIVQWTIFHPLLVIVLISSWTTIPIRRCAQRMVSGVTSWFMKQEVAAIELFLGVHYIDYGDLSAITNTDENVLIVANHPTLFDWMFLWTFLAKYSKLHKFRVLLKKELQYAPLIGYCVQASMFLFLARDWATDQSTIKSFLQYYEDYCEHYQLLIFPEGTNIGSHSVPKADQFTERQHIQPFNEVLPPRTTGFINIFMQLTGLSNVFSQIKDLPIEEQRQQATYDNLNSYVNMFSSVDAVYDFTIAYTPTRSSSQVNLITGKHPLTMHTHLSRIEIQQCLKEIMSISLIKDAKYYTDDEFNPYNPSTLEESEKKIALLSPEQLLSEQIGIWMMNLWYKKDIMLDNFYTKVHQHALVQPDSSSQIKKASTSTQKDKKHVDFTTNTVLLDPTTYIAASKPYYIYQWKQCLLGSFSIFSTFYFIYAISFFRWWFFIWNPISIVVLTVLKFQLHESILKGAKGYEDKCLQMIKKDDVAAKLHPDCQLVQQFRAQPTFADVQKLTLLQNKAHQNDEDCRNSFTTRQIRLQQREESRQLQLQFAIKLGDVNQVLNSTNNSTTSLSTPTSSTSSTSSSPTNQTQQINGPQSNTIDQTTNSSTAFDPSTLSTLNTASNTPVNNNASGKLGIPIDGEKYIAQDMEFGPEHAFYFTVWIIFYTIAAFQ